MAYYGIKFHEIYHEKYHDMRITQMSRTTGASVDELRYMEKKGFLQAVIIQIKRRQVRDYREEDVEKVKSIIRHRRQGFTWDTAYQKTAQDFSRPRLFQDV